MSVSTKITKKEKNAVEIDYENTCPFCTEKYNKTYRKEIKCYCEYSICRECFEKYTFEKEEMPHCPNCKVELSTEFLVENVNMAFRKDLREHRKKILFVFEKNQFPHTMEIIYHRNNIERYNCQLEYYIQQTKLVNTLIENYKFDIRVLKHHGKLLDDGIIKYELFFKEDISELNDANQIINIIANEIQTLHKKDREFQIQRDILYDKINGNIPKEKTERREFIRKCPVTDCLGFLSSQHKCGICSIYACLHCREIIGLDKNAPHVCDPNILQNIQLIESDSKNCPKCAVLIHKTDGCDMMWCVQCHIAFSWRTQKILTGNIHNPHYFEWQRTRTDGNGNVPRNPNDVLCGRDLSASLYRQINTKIAQKFYKGIPQTDIEEKQKLIEKIIRYTVEMMDYRFHTFNRTVQNYNPEQENLELRVLYLKKQMPEWEFLKRIEQNDHKLQKHTTIVQLMQMYRNLITDIMYKIDNDVRFDNVVACLEEVESLRQYTNAQFEKISKTFNCVLYQIDTDYKFR